MSKLTPKQEKFCNLYIETGNASEAYRGSYNVLETTKDKSVWEEASRLLADVKVSSRVAELKEEVQEKHAITREDIINMYLEIVSDSNDTMTLGRFKGLDKEDKSRFYRMAALTTNGDKLRALESLRKMLGYDSPEKIEHKVEVEISIKRNRL